MSIGTRDSLGDRMKSYEDNYRFYLTKRMPLIFRIDGKAFHSFTKNFQKPFDDVLMKAMARTTLILAKNLGAKLAYTQSDEISLLLTDYDTFNTEPWFGKNLQKMVSVAASMATLYFNRYFQEEVDKALESWSLKAELVEAYCKAVDSGAMFDARAFILPKEEVCNYFIWRQQDASRNSVQMLGRAHFSHKSLQSKSCAEIQDILVNEKGINWNDLPTSCKRGTCVVRWYDTKKERHSYVIDTEIPIFTQERQYIDLNVYLEDCSVNEKAEEESKS